MAQTTYGTFSRPVMAKAALLAMQEIQSLVEESLQAPHSDSSGLILAAEMEPYLDRQRRLVEQHLLSCAQCYSSFDWLIHLRKLLPEFWAGKLTTTGPYDATLAEVASGKSTTTNSRLRRPLQHIYRPVDETIAGNVSRLCAFAIYLSQIHTNLRWARKEVPFCFDKAGYPKAVPSEEQRQAVELYDSRVASALGLRLLRTGTAIDEKLAKPDAASVIPAAPRLVPRPGSKNELRLNFNITFHSLAGYGQLNQSLAQSGLQWWEPEAPLLTGFLRWILPLVTENVNHENPLQLSRCGCLYTNDAMIAASPQTYLDDAISFATGIFSGAQLPQTGAAFIEEISRLDGSLWPLRQGPVIRREQQVISIDLHAASMLLGALMRFEPAGGTLGRIRGRAFELSVQAVIDASDWAPKGQLRQLVHLEIPRPDGSTETDLDAIGAKENKLLLVSCKSREYSEKLDISDPQALHKVKQLASKAYSKCLQAKRFLEMHPDLVADLDIMRFEIVPVVCLPFVPYLPIGVETNSALDGLRNVVSLDELAQWLLPEALNTV
jgi:hypothetical protein